ncbi:MAG: ABC transporter ATP-binding protein [Coxiella sp. RIFCSPHIGHO2_12_FULL_42_15]|nr:MAG: ABC transporter ATP-binding protein [Coxiella sp. RIFCSPHIGHO2_12_FULL_42_15]
MLLINLRQIYLSYGFHPLFDHIDLQIESGEHVCLLGRNGMGKSTLLKLILGDVQPDAGIVDRGQSVIAYLPQTAPENFSGTVYDVVAEGLGELGQWLVQYEHINRELALHKNPKLMHQLADIQQRIENQNGWHLEQRVSKVLSQMTLDGALEVTTLSGGLQRRVLLAKALVTEPDLLILDEPTNHLDITAIEWLESFLKKYKQAILFVSHDRVFMQSIATRILELDNGELINWSGSYHDFLTHKAASLAAEQTQQALFDKKLAQEEVWIRQGIKARRTRNEGRVRALEKMRVERQERQQRMGNVTLTAQGFSQSGKVVFSAEKVHYGSILKNFSTTILRGDKIGIIGPNGSGKTTLLRILLGELPPEQGTVKQGTHLKMAYFDQHRALLDDNKTVQENVSPGAETLTINGKSRHVMSYLQDFLFSPERARSLVKVLSGGERNRLLLARLFTLEANVFVLDEPTNDLDVETLELLEEQLLNYQGTLLLVSHDREFLNNIVTSTLVLEGDGRVGEYVGGYDDWLRQRVEPVAEKSKAVVKTIKATNDNAKKLSYKEKVELEKLPTRIQQLESEIERLQQTMMDTRFYQKTSDEIAKVKQQLQQCEQQLSSAYARWEELEKIHSGSR